MPSEHREDLAAMFAWVARRLGEAEEPLLTARGLTMWEYIVLSRLARGPVPSQLTLAREVRHDKTRLVTLLDGLQQRGLITRTPDPTDRRSHFVAITDDGRSVHAAARAAIRTMEDEVLHALTSVERKALFASLSKLYTADHSPSTHTP